jgi:hypothetical protein
MRLEIDTGEAMEGLVYNSLRCLVDPGFFFLPTDPESNNTFVYVMKKALVDHRVLGIRPLSGSNVRSTHRQTVVEDEGPCGPGGEIGRKLDWDERAENVADGLTTV